MSDTVQEPITFQCHECGQPLMPTMNGSVCPNGHGKLRPAMPQKDQRTNVARIRCGAVDMYSVPGDCWTHAAAEGRRYEKVGRSITRRLDRGVHLEEGEIIGITEGKIYRFREASTQ